LHPVTEGRHRHHLSFQNLFAVASPLSPVCFFGGSALARVGDVKNELLEMPAWREQSSEFEEADSASGISRPAPLV
jgi:hypothetical protein